jgi:hypothetical protein
MPFPEARKQTAQGGRLLRSNDRFGIGLKDRLFRRGLQCLNRLGHHSREGRRNRFLRYGGCRFGRILGYFSNGFGHISGHILGDNFNPVFGKTNGFSLASRELAHDVHRRHLGLHGPAPA